MNSVTSASLRLALALLFGGSIMSACSGSGSDNDQLPSDSQIVSSTDTPSLDSESSADAIQVTDSDSADSEQVALSDSAEPSTEIQDATESDAIGNDNANPSVADPLIQNSTRVNFTIEVPAYQSDALQVQLVWADKVLIASWIGDQIWSAYDDFPTAIEHPLMVTFYDENGDTILGSYEKAFKTGTNASQSYQITADQFDTDRWDSDGDGISNINDPMSSSESAHVLLFSETQGYRHDSIENALAALEQLATASDIKTDRAADSSGVFTEANLAQYDAVVWVLTSGDVLDGDEQTAFEKYIRSGGGYAGIHAASDTEYDWPWYGNLVGAYFDRHPIIQSATQRVEDGSHMSTSHLNESWTRTDEWYDYRSNPRAQVNVLLSLDESSYSDGGMGEDHPSAWYHDYDGGRSWYTGGGHTQSSYSEPDFRAHLLGGLRYAAGFE